MKRFFSILLIAFLLINIIAIVHAYNFTHFSYRKIERTKNPKDLTAVEKLKLLFFGVSNPRPENTTVPSTAFETIYVQSNRKIETWSIKSENSKGWVILFHGYGGDKSRMLDKAEIFQQLGYSTLLVDFMGSGGSEGNQTTIGFLEAEQVRDSFYHLQSHGERNVYLLGTSMGAVAIMKALNDYSINPKGIIIECPFGSMYKTVCARFKMMSAPTFPIAGLLVFWGGVENGYWAFDHNPTEYAKSIKCPVLLLYGAKDEKVTNEETLGIFNNLAGRKALKIYADAGHENYLVRYKNEWTSDIQKFLNASNNPER